MKTLNKTILTVLSFWAISAGSAFAEADKLPDGFNYNIGAEVETTIVPSNLDVEIVSRLCVNDPDKSTCLAKGLQQAIEK